MIELVAQRPGDQILVRVTEDSGFIYSLGSKVRGVERNLQSIIARGYWEEPTRDLTDDYLEEIAKLPVEE